jgi:hypothetical protein
VAALEWSRQQERYDLCASIAVRMQGYWFAFMRVAEMMAWWRELDAGLPATDREHRAMALLLRSRAAMATGSLDEVNVCSGQALEMVDQDSWMALEALQMQGLYWSVASPEHVQRIFLEVRRIEKRAGLPPSPVMDLIFYHWRLMAAASSQEALAVLGEWTAGLEGAAPSPYIAGLFALYGDTATAADVLSNAAATHTPMGRAILESAKAVVASAQGQFDAAEHYLSVHATVVRDHAVPYGEAACLIFFAKLALDRGDLRRASRLLAAVKASAGSNDRPFRSHFESLVYFYCTRQLRSLLDEDSARRYQMEGAVLSCSLALDAELASRHRADNEKLQIPHLP